MFSIRSNRALAQGTYGLFAHPVRKTFRVEDVPFIAVKFTYMGVGSKVFLANNAGFLSLLLVF